jgi:hypothetical protein
LLTRLADQPLAVVCLDLERSVHELAIPIFRCSPINIQVPHLDLRRRPVLVRSWADS